MFQELTLELRPTSEYELPNSDGHLLYAAILEELEQEDSTVSEKLHNADTGINISCLDGVFSAVKGEPRKTVFDDETYTARIGLSGLDEETVLQPLNRVFQKMLFSSAELEVGDGSLVVENASLEETTVEQLKKQASEFSKPEITFYFDSPTCIRYGREGVFEAFPHRMAVYSSLRERWNRIVSEKHELKFDNDAIGSKSHEVNANFDLSHHNLIVSKYDDIQSDAEIRKPIKRTGFTGHCTYRLIPEASESFKNFILILSQAAEFIGVGSDIARGCGTVTTEIRELEEEND